MVKTLLVDALCSNHTHVLTEFLLIGLDIWRKYGKKMSWEKADVLGVSTHATYILYVSMHVCSIVLLCVKRKSVATPLLPLESTWELCCWQLFSFIAKYNAEYLHLYWLLSEHNLIVNRVYAFYSLRNVKLQLLQGAVGSFSGCNFPNSMPLMILVHTEAPDVHCICGLTAVFGWQHLWATVTAECNSTEAPLESCLLLQWLTANSPWWLITLHHSYGWLTEPHAASMKNGRMGKKKGT